MGAKDKPTVTEAMVRDARAMKEDTSHSYTDKEIADATGICEVRVKALFQRFAMKEDNAAAIALNRI